MWSHVMYIMNSVYGFKYDDDDDDDDGDNDDDDDDDEDASQPQKGIKGFNKLKREVNDLKLELGIFKDEIKVIERKRSE